MSKVTITIFIAICVLFSSGPAFAQNNSQKSHPIYALVNEHLAYDISFLWFDRLAEGSIELTLGEEPGTFLILMQAKTLGVAAFFTGNRVEKFQTLMRIGADGMLHPLWHSSHTLRDKGNSRSEKITKSIFDYETGRVRFQKIKNERIYADEWFGMDDGRPLFDILSALYNLRLGYYGKIGERRILITTFHQKGTQDIIVEPLEKMSRKDRKFFADDSIQTRILVDPSVFGTKGRDILASFDTTMRPQKGIIKNVIGLGDVRGTLRSAR